MQPDAANARQQIVERVKQATNILIAVGTDPSVDALSAALGMALMLNKMDKHATAVFSGKMPPSMDFLNAGKTFENTVDSLRDFIISLDKEKADRLRYKVENDAVRIFITPYKTTISEKDLQFSQGDFNVELIVALGVEKRDDLDKAIVAHGRILHDATVVTINASADKSNLGTVDWHDPAASSLCEMLTSMAESFQQPGLMDTQIATALLTGVVAATERFSNNKTNPKIMTMAAQLMAAGANQQLIAINLTKKTEPQAEGQLAEGAGSVKLADEEPKKDGELDIEHPKGKEKDKDKPKADIKAAGAMPANLPVVEVGEPSEAAENELAAALPVAEPMFEKLKADLNEETKAQEPKAGQFLRAPGDSEPGSKSVNMAASEAEEEKPADQPEPYLASHGSWREKRLEPPDLGGTLNATSEQAQADAQKEVEDNRNKTLLNHDSPVGVSAPAPAPTSDVMALAAADAAAADTGTTDTPSVPPTIEPPVEPAPDAPVPDVPITPDETPVVPIGPPPPAPEPVTEPLVNEAPSAVPPDGTPAMPSLPVFEPDAAGNVAQIADASLPSLPPVEPALDANPAGDVPPLPPLPSSEPSMAPPTTPASDTPVIEPYAPAADAAPAAPATDLPPLATPPVVTPSTPDLGTTPPVLDAPAEPAPVTPPADAPVPVSDGKADNADLDAARDAVNAALSGAPFNPANEPLASVGALPLGGPLNPPTTPDLGAAPSGNEPLPPLPPLPPLATSDGQPLPPPPLSTEPPVINPAPDMTPPPLTPPPAEPPVPTPDNPGQFKIPGQ